MPKKMSLEEEILTNILRAAKKCKSPFSIAKAYGILVDKLAKCSQKLRREIKGTLDELLAEVKRAAGESNGPGNIAMAFGILIDKKIYGSKEAEEEGKADPIEKEEDREKLYDELGIKAPNESKGKNRKGKTGSQAAKAS